MEKISPICCLAFYIIAFIYFCFKSISKTQNLSLLHIFNALQKIHFFFFSVNKVNRICFISAYFPITQGVQRHSVKDYVYSSRLFFSSFNPSVPLFIFTSNAGLEILRASLPNTTLNLHFITKYQNAFEIPQISRYKAQYEYIDSHQPQSYPVSSEIGAIWNAKFVFLPEVYNELYPNADFYFWADIRMLKTEYFFHQSEPFIWPDLDRILKIFSYRDTKTNKTKIYQKMLIGVEGGARPFLPPLEKLKYPIKYFRVLAGFFGGPIDILKFFISEYWKIHDTLIARNQFVLREEFQMAAFSIYHKDKTFLIYLRDSKCDLWESAVGFVAKYNVCQFNNQVLHFSEKNDSSYGRPAGVFLDSWS